VDALGNLVRFLLLPGQAHDMKGVAPLIKGVSFDALLADKAFDADWLLQDLDERGATAVIPPKTNRKSSAIMMRRSTSGAIWWRIISQRSKSSEG
jgi:transposase